MKWGMECWQGGEGWSSSGTRGLVSDPFLDVCSVWGPVIHWVTCSDLSSLSTSISVSVTMVRIKEGSVGPEEGSRERNGERERREKLASKAEAVHAGNTEITASELIKNAQFRYSQCEGSLGLWNLYHSENLHSHKCWLMKSIIFCSGVNLHSPNLDTHLTDGIQNGTELVRGHYSKVVAGPIIFTSCSGAGFFTAHTLPVSSQPLSESLGTLNFSVLFNIVFSL